MGNQRIELDEYPVAAVRDMNLNALVHRNYMGSATQIRLYEDHFSVWNDGPLPEGISEEDLMKVHRSKPRNPLLADVSKATARRDIKELEDKGILKNIGTKKSSAVYQMGVGS